MEKTFSDPPFLSAVPQGKVNMCQFSNFSVTQTTNMDFNNSASRENLDAFRKECAEENRRFYNRANVKDYHEMVRLTMEKLAISLTCKKCGDEFKREYTFQKHIGSVKCKANAAKRRGVSFTAPKDVMVTCVVCDRDVKRVNFPDHKSSSTHKMNVLKEASGGILEYTCVVCKTGKVFKGQRAKLMLKRHCKTSKKHLKRLETVEKQILQKEMFSKYQL